MVVGQLLAAGAAVDAKNKVRGRGGGRIGEGRESEHSSACALGFLVVCFSDSGFQLASKTRKGVGHVTTV